MVPHCRKALVRNLRPEAVGIGAGEVWPGQRRWDPRPGRPRLARVSLISSWVLLSPRPLVGNRLNSPLPKVVPLTVAEALCPSPSPRWPRGSENATAAARLEGAVFRDSGEWGKRSSDSAQYSSLGCFVPDPTATLTSSIRA